MEVIPKDAKQTITFDNGFENSGWKKLEELVKIKAYFAHQYHSWERGTNENTNGLIRDYFPKKTDFTTIQRRRARLCRKRAQFQTQKTSWLENPIRSLECCTSELNVPES